MLVEDVERLRSAPFADLVPSLTVEPDGCIVPFTYGFRRKWSLGFIGQKPLDRMVEAWRATCAAPVATILRSTLERLAAAYIEYCDLFWEMLVSAPMASGGMGSDRILNNSLSYRFNTSNKKNN